MFYVINAKNREGRRKATGGLKYVLNGCRTF